MGVKPHNCFHLESSKVQGKWGDLWLNTSRCNKPYNCCHPKTSKEKPHNCFHSKSSKVQGRGGIFDLWLVECWQMIDRAGEIRGLRGQFSPARDLDGYWSQTFFLKTHSITSPLQILWPSTSSNRWIKKVNSFSLGTYVIFDWSLNTNTSNFAKS